MPLSGVPDGYAGPPATELIWTDLIYAPVTIYTGAGKIYIVDLIAKSGTQRAYINDNADAGESNKILEPWTSQYAPHIIIPLFGAPIPFSTGLSINWLSGTETHLALKIAYTKD